MTWGQLRFQLQQSAGPGLALDLLDEWLNSRYEQVLAATDWTGRKTHVTIETQAAYQSAADTVTVTVGSASVTGSGTAWTGALVGQRLYRPGDEVVYTVAAVADGTHLTLDRTYEGNGADAAGTVYGGAAYVLMQNVYALPVDCESVTSILDPVSGFPLAELSKAQMDASAGPRTLVADPGAYALYDDTSQAAGDPVLHQVEFYPPPLYARGMIVSYAGAAIGWDGTSVGSSPLPFVSTAVLLNGVRADIAMHQGQLPKAVVYEKKFGEELERLLMVDHARRRGPVALTVAGRFTRHRLARTQRGLGNYWGPGQGGPN